MAIEQPRYILKKDYLPCNLPDFLKPIKELLNNQQVYCMLLKDKQMGVWIVDEIIRSAEKTIAEPIKLSNLTPTMKCWFPNLEDAPLKYLAEHIHRVNKADIEKPILLLKPYRIIDGYHRYLKALLENHETIKGKVLEKNDLPKPLKILSMP